MITYNENVIGIVTIKHKGSDFLLEIRQGNCLGVVIYPHEENGKTMHTLFNFFADETHLKRIVNDGLDIFSYPVKEIRLNTYYKEAMKIAKHLVKKHEITLYYKEICTKK